MKTDISPSSSSHSSSVTELLGFEDAQKLTHGMLRDALEHLLAVPLEKTLNLLPQPLGDKLRQVSADRQVYQHAQVARTNSFGQLFTLPDPPLPMLDFAKSFGKATTFHGKTYWPKPVCEALYYASYAAGIARLQTVLGGLDPVNLERGFRKLAERPWMTEDLRGLFQTAIAGLTAVTKRTS